MKETNMFQTRQLLDQNRQPNKQKQKTAPESGLQIKPHTYN